MNMAIKFLEIRDEGTFIPCVAMKFGDLTEAERYLVARAGWGVTEVDRSWYVWLFDMNGDLRGTSDPYSWRDNYTMHLAHKYLRDGGGWDELQSGDVLDVRTLRPVDDPIHRDTPVVSDRLAKAWDEA